MNRYAIFNKKKNRFWSSCSAGYTDDIQNLGQYSLSKAGELLKIPNKKEEVIEAIDIREIHKHRLFKIPRKPEGKRGNI